MESLRFISLLVEVCFDSFLFFKFCRLVRRRVDGKRGARQEQNADEKIAADEFEDIFSVGSDASSLMPEHDDGHGLDGGAG